jgi:para-nitrobenzyl esterase
VLALEPRLIPAVRKLTAPRILRMICDGWVVPMDERDAFETGAFHAVPAIVGSNTDEGSRLIATWPVDDIAGWNTIIEDNFSARADEARRLYPVAADSEARAAVANMFGDTQFLLGTREIARAVNRKGAKAYRYLFTRRRAGSADGPHHGGETPYVFGHLDQPPYGTSGTPDARDVALSSAIRASWIRFAATGAPGPIDGLEWPVAAHGFVELGERSYISRIWRDEQLDFLNAYTR